MAAITFPMMATNGQTYEFGGTTYEYNLARNRWEAQAAGGGSITVSQTRPDPATSSPGDLWWYCGDTGEDPSLFTLLADASGQQQWVQSSPGVAFESGTVSATPAGGGELTGLTIGNTSWTLPMASGGMFTTSAAGGGTPGTNQTVAYASLSLAPGGIGVAWPNINPGGNAFIRVGGVGQGNIYINTGTTNVTAEVVVRGNSSGNSGGFGFLLSP